jgi:hypothetical protein
MLSGSGFHPEINSFGNPVTQVHELAESVTGFASRAA